MSYTELHTGRLRVVKELSLEEFKIWLSEQKDLTCDDLHEKLEDNYHFFDVYDNTKRYKEKGYWRYFYNKGVLYELVEHYFESDASDIYETSKVGEDIKFTYMFYNGGTCFVEVIEEGLNKIKDE